ncbi:hypothetical protein BDR04DRAFT_820584 [Suillus decipiens]|nr:hypothetical protein BDR04DRAFT_820584 [Suillus decipiens]
MLLTQSLKPIQLLSLALTCNVNSCRMLLSNSFQLASMISLTRSVTPLGCCVKHNAGTSRCASSGHCMESPTYGACRNLHKSIKKMRGGPETAVVE